MDIIFGIIALPIKLASWIIVGAVYTLIGILKVATWIIWAIVAFTFGFLFFTR